MSPFSCSFSDLLVRSPRNDRLGYSVSCITMGNLEVCLASSVINELNWLDIP